ncbi:hypothetical protein CDL12_02612 [Handroanthus impetiginosus]|uniref:Uncharacterized protein n=1 Tax=Handroanthus impetiginosus TaxID=429701 RepID=A0A2G9I4H7_9LAMI|nr:hypothetical protein CDL12_02612 [Handroanthus impetiginosus]
MKLIAEELASTIILSDIIVQKPDNNGKHMLIGRVVTQKAYSMVVLRANLMRFIVLQPVKGMEVRQVGIDNLLLVFEHALEKSHALLGYPWIMDKHAVILSEILEDPTSVELIWMPIIVHLLNIPRSNASAVVVE